ncbi:hypothetical protein Q3G72_014437 [Acer saccharum]|nr:hypothetical protein Q3G72_014437 [Acer saccharum]
MEVVVAIIGSAVTEAGRSLCRSFPSIKNFISFQSNLSVLEKEKKSLVDLQNKVIEDVDYSSDAQMIQWLREVEQILLEVNSVQASMTASNQKLCGCFFNYSERYRFSKETARMLKEIERLLKVGDIAVKLVGRNYLAKAVEHIPGPSFVNQTTASQNLAKVMDLLNDDDVLRIGVWGMGGVVSFCKKLERLFEQDRKKTEAPVCVVPNLQLLSSSQCICAALFCDVFAGGSAVAVACHCTGDWRNAHMLLF